MIHIYTDGSCAGNPGPGGWAALIVTDHDTPKELGGHEDSTTNNRMEQTAAIKALELVPAGAEATLHSDSEYLVKTMTKGWKRNANQDLWARLDMLAEERRVQWNWVKGHNGHPQNEFVNALAEWQAGVRTARPKLTDFVRPEKTKPAPDALTHLDAQGRARMVDVGGKEATARVAVAKGSVHMKPETLRLIQEGRAEKGDVLATARIAGIMAAKRTPDLIPLCHPIPLDQVTVDMELDQAESTIHITATARTTAKTGVEMEALTAVSVAALTIYDMVKSVDRGMRIENIRLASKSGGKSGDIVLEA